LASGAMTAIAPGWATLARRRPNPRYRAGHEARAMMSAGPMLLNRFEYVLMNNPLRATLQRHVEVRQLLRLGGPMRGGRALEIGYWRKYTVSSVRVADSTQKRC
jgi:hypothetical protein